MPVAEQSTITRYITNGTTATFAAGFVVASAAEISVYIDDVLQSTALWSYSGGNVVFVTIPPSGSVVSIQRVTPLERETSYTNSTNQFLPSVLDTDLDRIWLALQDMKTNLSRALALPISDQSNPFTVLADLRTWLETAKNLADDTALPRLAEIETALDNLSARLTQVEFEVPATEQVLQAQINALVVALAQVGGGAKAYQTLALLNASGAPSSPNLLAYVTNDTTPANNGLYSHNGTAWIKSLYDPLTQAIAAVNAEAAARTAADADLLNRINSLLANAGLVLDVLHNPDGKRLAFSVVHQATDKILFSVDTQQGVYLAGFELTPSANFAIRDAGGRELLSVKNGIVSIWGASIAVDKLVGLLVSDVAGRQFIRFKDGELYLFNLKVSFGKSRSISLNTESGRSILHITPSGKVYIPSLVANQPEVDTTDIYASIYKAASLSTGQHKMLDRNHVLFYGQSLSRSTSHASPIISSTQPYNNVMLSGGVRTRVGDAGYAVTGFAPLVEFDIESPVAGTLNGLARRFNSSFGTPPCFVGSSNGDGGDSAETLSPAEFGGVGWFEKATQYITDTKALCDSLGDTYAVSAYSYIQGENDSDTALWLYAERVKRIKQEFDKRLMQITGQDFVPCMFIYQTGAHRRYNNDFMSSALVQWRMSRTYPDIVMFAPVYMMPHAADYLHLTAEGSWLMGEYQSRAMFETLFMHSRWEPLQPIEVQWGTTTITVKYNARSQLVIDTALCAATHNSGFDVWESGAVNTSRISSVAVTSFDTITITLSSAAPSDAVLTCGRGRPTDPDYAGPVLGARTNIRDSAGLYDTAVSPLGNTFALHNASVMWQYSRRDGFNA